MMLDRPSYARTLLLGLLLPLAGCGEAVEESRATPAADPGIVQLTPEQVRTAGIEVQAVSLDSVPLPVRVPGTLTSPDTALASLGSIVEGQVGQVLVVPGDEVKRGQPLMRIHAHELTDALRDRDAARARLEYTSSALERSRLLLEAGAVSREEVERRQAEFEQVQAEMIRSEEWVRHLNPSPDGEVVVRSPRDGVVFRVHVGPGSAVTPGAPLLELGGTGVLWVTGFVPENTAARLSPGTAVEVALSALPERPLSARIVRMGGMVDPQRRAVEVRAELDEVPAGARPGMFATLTLAAGDPTPRALLPSESVQRTAEGEVAYIEEEPARYRAVQVSATPLGEGRLAVEGLADGARVVTRGAYVLRSAHEGVEAGE